jgi:predicted dehydrogenase
MLRVIHAGVGGRGRWPLEVLGSDPRFESVALVDLVAEHLAAARAVTGLPEAACFTTLEAALAAVEAEAVVICTPTKTHAAFCRTAFGAGKHVLVEKGMTLDWREANALVADAAAARMRFCVSQNYRYMAELRTLQKLIADGEYGTPHLIDLINHRYRPEPRTLDYPFAMVWDMGCHHFDNLICAFGPVARVTAVAHNAPWSAYDYDAGVTAVLEFRSGAVCTYELTHQATLSDYRFLVQTERGALHWDDVDRRWHFRPKPERQLGRSTEDIPLESVAVGRSEQGVVDDWYRFIMEGTEPGISGRQNLETLAVCEMVVRAATDRRPVERAELDR